METSAEQFVTRIMTDYLSGLTSEEKGKLLSAELEGKSEEEQDEFLLLIDCMLQELIEADFDFQDEESDASATSTIVETEDFWQLLTEVDKQERRTKNRGKGLPRKRYRQQPHRKKQQRKMSGQPAKSRRPRRSCSRQLKTYRKMLAGRINVERIDNWTTSKRWHDAVITKKWDVAWDLWDKRCGTESIELVRQFWLVTRARIGGRRCVRVGDRATVEGLLYRSDVPKKVDDKSISAKAFREIQ
jgi:hypothetical protein